jgi:predicted membrane-bound spermidine synthase
MGVGFLSLSQEILWVRLISFVLKGMSQSFAAVLFCFLVGIAVGSAIGKRFCERRVDLLGVSATVLGVAAAVDVSLVIVLPALVQWRAGLVGVFLLVFLTAALKSVMFPIAHHLGADQSGARIGRSVSKVYFGNIVGSTLGPIVTGYILLDHLTVDACLLLVGAMTGILSLLCAARVRKLPLALVGALVLTAAGVIAWSGVNSMIPALALATQRVVLPGSKVEHVVQNRQGVIHTVYTPDGEPDTILGGNIYDGRVNTEMKINYNGLDRALVLLAVHPNPERVLVIGLSTGAWARILSASPRVKEIVAVEINPGYLEVIAKYPQVNGLLSDPRVRIVIDDGRRWLRRNPGEAFDLIVQNTTFYWRAYSTNLLSREYMQLTMAHLKPGGIAAFNSTSSGDVLETARAVFPFVERRKNFIYGGAAYFGRVIDSVEQVYRELALGDHAVFDAPAFEAGGIVKDMLDSPFVPHDEQYANLSRSPEVITDQNLLVENAHGKMREFLPRFFRGVDEARRLLSGS